MRIRIENNTSTWTSKSLWAALKKAMDAPNNPYAARVERVSFIVGKGRTRGPRCTDLKREGSMAWSVRLTLPPWPAKMALAVELRMLARVISKAPPEPYDHTAPRWYDQLQLEPKLAPAPVDVEVAKAKERAAKIAHCRAKVDEWSKKETDAARWKRKWEKQLKAQERAAVRADEKFLKSGQIGLSFDDLKKADAAFAGGPDE